MKRSIVFILTVILAVAFLVVTFQTVTGYGDDVSIAPEHIYGDPKRVEGITLELKTTCDNHMIWYTRHTAGDPGKTETEFIFNQNNIHQPEFVWDDFNFYISGGFGISTSGGSIDIGNSGWGKAVNQIAKEVENGQSLEKEILLEDYFDYYPMDYYSSIQTSMYWIDEHQDATRDSSYDSGSYGRWIQDFKFPVVSGAKGHVSLTKAEDGSIVELGVQIYDVGEAGFVTCIWEEGMYFAPVFTSFEGEPLTNGEFVEGYGLYHIPFTPRTDVEFVSDTSVYAAQFDHDNRELIYPLDSDDRVVAMEAGSDGRLHLILQEDGRYRYCALELENRTVTHQIDLMDAGEVLWKECEFFLDQGLIYVRSDSRIALLDVNGEPSLEFVVQVPEEVEMITPASVSYRNGTLYAAALDWVEREDETGLEYRSVKANYLAAIDAEGFGYFGYYYSDLIDRGHTYTYVSQDQIKILE